MIKTDDIKSNLTLSDMMTGRKNNFDFLRFLFAALVIYHHSFDLLLSPRGSWGQPSPRFPDPILLLTNGTFESGYSSVNAFFVMSGFLITSSWVFSSNGFDFVKKRLLRIYPGWIAALLFCIFVIGPLYGVSTGEYFRNHDTYSMLKTLFLKGSHDALPGVFITNPYPIAVNGSLWTLPIEFKCYAMVMIFGLLRMLKVRYVVLIIFLMVHTYYIVAQSSHLNIPHIGAADILPRLVAYFLSGMTLFLFRDKIPFSNRLALLSALAIVVMSFFHLSELAMPICGSYLILFFAYSPRVKLHNFAKYGDFSYGLYIYAFPIQQLIIHVFKDGKGINPYTLAILSFVVTLTISVLSWHLIEKPFLSLKPKLRAGIDTQQG